METHRPLPHSHEAEQGVLSSILLSPKDVMADCSDQITEDHFHHPANSVIYSVLLDMHQKSIPIDLISLTQTLADRSLLNQVGGAEYITGLQTFLPTAANVDFYIQILLGKKDMRSVIDICHEYQERAYSEPEPEAMVGELKEKVAQIGLRKEESSKNDLLGRYIDELDRRQKGEVNHNIIPTGFCCIDSRSGGVYRKNMGVISAKPGVGKSTWGRGIAQHVGIELGIGALIISVENSFEEIMDTLVSSMAKVPHDTLKRKKLDKGQLGAVLRSLDRISQSNLHVIANPSLGLEGIKSAFRKYKPDFGFVDYIQKIKSPECKEDGSREQQLAYLSAELARLADECNCYLLVGSQETESQSGKVNTKHCTSITEDAHDWFRLLPVKDEPNLRKFDCMKRRSAEGGWDDRLTFLRPFVSLENHSPLP